MLEVLKFLTLCIILPLIGLMFGTGLWTFAFAAGIVTFSWLSLFCFVGCTTLGVILIYVKIKD